tara:strand:- start:797 stop:1330 length:534 start_codon:yes stop_codon:yes gene_type:complete
LNKVCNRCKELKSFSEFYRDKGGKDGLRRQCKSCDKQYNDSKCIFKTWFASHKCRSKNKGKESTIEPTDIPGVKIRRFKVRGKWTWVATQYPKVCFKWGIELSWSMNGVSQYNSPSLDRIDPTKGYIPGNVRIVCQAYNMAKGNCPPDEWDILENKIAKSILSYQQLDTNPNQLSLL